MSELPVFKDDQLVGFMDSQRVRRNLGQGGTPAWQIEEEGWGRWHELYELRDGRYVLVECTFADDDGVGFREHCAHLIDRKAALAWMKEHAVRPPDDWLAEMGLEDLTPPTPEDEEREAKNAMGAVTSLTDEEQCTRTQTELEVHTATSPASQTSQIPAISDKIAYAIALLSLHPDWTNSRIAEHAGLHEKSLSRNSKFKAARNAIRSVGAASHHRAKESRGAHLDQYES
jgi:hypothetical protein